MGEPFTANSLFREPNRSENSASISLIQHEDQLRWPASTLWVLPPYAVICSMSIFFSSGATHFLRDSALTLCIANSSLGSR